MKNKILFLLLISFNISAQNNFNCFTVLAGKYATDDESVLLAHNEDDGGDQVVNLYKIKRVTAPDSIMVTMLNGGTLKLAPTTYATIWFEMPGMKFSDSYQNEYGVTIVSDACRSKEDKPELTDGGIGYWLRRAIVLQAKTARQAVKIGGQLVEKYGYDSSGRTYSIADKNEAWMLSVVNGKHWVAQRVPDDEVAIIPNYYTIQKVNLQDTVNFYGSKDLIDYARKRGWFKGKDFEFDFRKAYGNPETNKHPVNIERHWDAIRKLADEKFELNDNFPFSFYPKEMVKLSDLFAVLRSHYEGTPLDKSENYTKASPHETHRAICANSTQYAMVAQLRNYVSDKFNPIWVSFVHPCSHVFVPLYNGIEDFPPEWKNYIDAKTALTKHFAKKYKIQKEHPFIKITKDARKIDKKYAKRIAIRKKSIEKKEKALLANQKMSEQQLFDKYKLNKEVIGMDMLNYFNYLMIHYID